MLKWPLAFFRSTGIPTYEVDNIVGEGTTVRGDLRGPGGFRIDGTVVGSIESDGPIVIGEKGAVEGTIKARDVVVLGRVLGNLSAKAHLEVGPEGRVMGDVDVVSVKVHAGGAFHGASRIGVAAGEPGLSANTNTRPIGILPVSTTPDLAVTNKEKGKSGRTLPPPLGAVPPPPPAAVGAPTKQLPMVTPSPSPAVSTVERIATREEPKAAAND
jgi:cytoskeletal protein CcmA (bactofilin family)